MKDINLQDNTKDTDSILSIYKSILEGKRNHFPRGTWNTPNARKGAVACLKYLLNDVLKLPIEEQYCILNRSFLEEHYLNGMINSVYFNNISVLFKDLFGEEVNPLKVGRRVYREYWTKETAADAIRWLIEEKLHLTKEQVKEQFSTTLLTENGLTALKMKYSLYELLDIAYPGEYKEWDLNYISNKACLEKEEDVKEYLLCQIQKYGFSPAIETPGSWGAKVQRSALREVSRKEIYQMTCDLYYSMQPPTEDNKAQGTNSSTTTSKSDYLETVSPVEIYKAILEGKRYQFPIHYWRRSDRLESARECVRYLIEEELQVPVSDIPKVITRADFLTYGLSSMLKVVFNNNLIDTIENAYPNRFHPLEFPSLPRGYWDKKENIIDAIKWVLNKKKKECKEKGIPFEVHRKDFNCSYKFCNLMKLIGRDNFFSIVDNEVEKFIKSEL